MPSVAKPIADCGIETKNTTNRVAKGIKKNEKNKRRRQHLLLKKREDALLTLAPCIEPQIPQNALEEGPMPLNGVAAVANTPTMEMTPKPQFQAGLNDSVILIPPPEISIIDILDDDDEVKPAANSKLLVKSAPKVSDDKRTVHLPIDGNDNLQVHVHRPRESLGIHRTPATPYRPKRQQIGIHSTKHQMAATVPTLPNTVFKRMSIVNLLQPQGNIPCRWGKTVYNAVQNLLFNTQYSDSALTPRFHTFVWENGCLNVCCRDASSRNLLVQYIREIRLSFEDCVLAAIKYDSFRWMRKIELWTDIELKNSTQFLNILELQNPVLNVRDWLPFKCSEHPHGMVYSLYVDAYSFQHLVRNNGCVNYYNGWLSFHLYPN